MRTFQVLLNARLHPHRDNDGDSFHLLLKEGQAQQFRLYFADCPEKKRHAKTVTGWLIRVATLAD